MVRCARCHRVITDPAAIEAGYGAKCYAKEFGKKLKSPARPRKGKTATQPKSTAERQIIGQLTVYDILAAHEKALTRTASALQMDRDPHIPLALDAGTSSRKIQVSTTHNHIVAYSVEFFNRYEAARKDYPFCRFSMQKLGGTTWKKNLLPP